MQNDKEIYNDILFCIENNELDIAWQKIKRIKSETLRNSFISPIQESMSNKIRYKGYYKDMWGNYHEYDDSNECGRGGGKGNEPEPNGKCDLICGIIIGIGCLVSAIICSIKYNQCCCANPCICCAEIVNTFTSWCCGKK